MFTLEQLEEELGEALMRYNPVLSQTLCMRVRVRKLASAGDYLVTSKTLGCHSTMILPGHIIYIVPDAGLAQIDWEMYYVDGSKDACVTSLPYN